MTAFSVGSFSKPSVQKRNNKEHTHTHKKKKCELGRKSRRKKKETHL